MYIAMIVVFVLGYLAIALEHPIHIDKAASALVTGVVCWALYAVQLNFSTDIEHQVLHHISEIAGILFFLIGAMTIVELVDAHDGFSIITDRVKTQNQVKLLWIVGLITFFLSAVLDNLTTAIVMVSLLRKLIESRQKRWLFAGVVVIAANAGGAWSPIGDVTTTMLWIGKQITAFSIIRQVFLPSLVCLVVPLIYLSFKLKGNLKRPTKEIKSHHDHFIPERDKKILFIAGIAGLLFVPIFKTVTHLPPFMGMMLSLGIIWIISERMHRDKDYELKRKLTVIGVLRKIDTASVLFFLGILLAVASLQSAGQLGDMADLLDNSIGTTEKSGIYIVSIFIGLLSSIVDNVPLVAAAMGMYPIDAAGYFMQDGLFWEFLAYCAGTGGSALIIGSAAGVAVMGIEGIDFIWYMRRISVLALMGYFSGAVVYIIQHYMIH